jgi:shikimate kinase / 3-dehydroquinate synthase
MSPGASDPNKRDVRSHGLGRPGAAEAATTNLARSHGLGHPGAAEAATRNLVITGFMGTGKTRVGREVARCLGRPFVDMDAEIERRAGKPVPRIFAEDGEPAFRHMEAALAEELGAGGGRVIATGGGTLVDAANRARLMRHATAVCLTCHPDEILRRVTTPAGDERPLLNGDEPRAEIERLLAQRQEAYATLPWQIDTTGRPVDELAGAVAAFASVETLAVHGPEGEYPVHVGSGLLPHLGGALRAAGIAAGTRIAVVSNPVVEPLYGAEVQASLQSAGFEPASCLIPDGERHKTLDTVAGLYEQFLAVELDRSGLVLSLGGGVTGDLAGFAAATFMRGVAFAQMPTTLLAMVDASVGGKTGVDLPQGKNLVGAFKQPVLVLVDPRVLATLPEAEVRSGMAEAIKHSVLADPSLFAELEAATPDLQQPLSDTQLARSIGIKVAVVQEDPLEQGRRAILNLGHTVGHALERLSDYSLRHGEAVASGMVAATRLAIRLGRAQPSLAGRIEAVLAAWGLPTRCPPFEVEAIWAAMAHDKKRRGRSLRWVLPRDLGDVEIAGDVPPEAVKSVLQEMGARRST